MNVSFDNFLKKYYLDDFNKPLELKGKEKIELFNDLNNLLQAVCRILNKLTNIASLRGGQVLMSLAKLESIDSVVNKTDIMHNLNIDRLEKLLHAFNYLENENYIKIEKKTPKFHIIRLNEEDNPDFVLFKEIVQKFWSSPEENKDKTKSWSDYK
ncbi:MAG: hypothetical protein ACFE85_15970 [Candidatus Hodarchaeota archaeon]